MSDSSHTVDAQLVSEVVAAYTQVGGGPGTLAQAPNPVTLPEAFTTLSESDAYAFQEALIDGLMSTYGGERRGYKIGGVDPFYGVLLDSHLLGTDDEIELATANSPMFEPEILVRTTRELDAQASTEHIAASVEMAAGIEMPVSRFANWSLTFPRTALIADNALSTYVVTGSSWFPSLAPEATVNVTLTHPNGVSTGSRTAASVYEGVAWLVRALSSRGQTLAAGSLIATGTLLANPPAIPLTAGTYTASFDNGLGNVAVTAN
ncbi:MAG: 2-keto-4-pentenoate hydratase [Cumulibacter sp.]